MNLPKFKKTLQNLKTYKINLDKTKIDQFADYCDKNEDGFILFSTVMECIEKFSTYNPLLEVEVPFVPQDPDIPPIDIAELILPLATAIKAKGSSVEKIFKIYDKDKSFLLSAKEIALVIKFFLDIEIE